MRISIALKIFAIVTLMIAAMAAASAVGVRMAQQASEAVEELASGYFEVYSGIARINVYSLAQAVAVREYAIDLLAPGAVRNHSAASTREAVAELSQRIDGELKRARAAMAQELDALSSLVGHGILGRIDERLAWIESEQDRYEDKIAAIVERLESGDHRNVDDEFDRLVEWRAGFNRYVDETRHRMHDATAEAATNVYAAQRRATLIGLLVTGMTALLALAAAFVLTRQLVRPVRSLLQATTAVADGRLDIEVPVTSSDEIGRLAESFNRMTDELRIGLQARQAFGNYVDPRIAKLLIESTGLATDQGERREMTILFCDLAGFTRASEAMTPRGLVAVVNRYCTLMSEAVREHHGVIDKFIGDGVMAYWGPPFVDEGEHAALAGLAALEQIAKMEQLRAELPELLALRRGLPELGIRVGIATGEVVVGSIGSDLMRNYTVMGDAVNLAARLEAANKVYGTGILIAAETARQCRDRLELREIDSLAVAGTAAPIPVFEILGAKGTLSADAAAARDAFADGLAAYRRRDWDTAAGAFTRARDLLPGDGGSRLYLDRIAAFRADPPPDDWDGAWRMLTK